MPLGLENIIRLRPIQLLHSAEDLYLKGASKFHDTSIKKMLLVGPDLLQNIVFVPLRFCQHQKSVSVVIQGFNLQVAILSEDQPFLRFL